MIAEGVHRKDVSTSQYRRLNWSQEILCGVGAILVGGLLAWERKRLPK